MRAPVGTVAPESTPSYQSGTTPIVSQGGENEADTASADDTKKAPTYSDTNTPQTLSEIYQSYLQSVGSGTLGGGFSMNGSLQPEAPQESGNVLARMGGMMQGKGKWILVALVVLALIWYFNRKKG